MLCPLQVHNPPPHSPSKIILRIKKTPDYKRHFNKWVNSFVTLRCDSHQCNKIVPVSCSKLDILIQGRSTNKEIFSFQKSRISTLQIMNHFFQIDIIYWSGNHYYMYYHCHNHYHYYIKYVSLVYTTQINNAFCMPW